MREAPKLGEILDALFQSGANQMSGLRFDVSDPGPLRDEARRLAVEDARRKAEILAEAAGVRLGAPLTIIEGGAGAAPQFRPQADMAMSRAAETTVLPGSHTLAAQVTVTWSLD